jgi:dTDP-4-dehydrorhamnose 3,5-epimerase
MIFTATRLPGGFVVDLERLEDERGFFARSWCRQAFEERGLAPRLMQCSVSFNKTRGTLRGMHYQAKPYAEAKLVRCTRGAVYDVIIDLRSDSPAYLQWDAVELTEENHRMVYVPEGCAHGFQTLVDGTEVFYQMSEVYRPEYARGVRWNDPAFAIHWPEAERIISARDDTYPDFVPERAHRVR